MSTPWYRRVSEGLSRTREDLTGRLNVILRRGPDLDEEFWTDLEDALIGADMGVTAVADITDSLRDAAARKALPDAAAVVDQLGEELVREFPAPAEDFLAESPLTLLVVGVNGTGKTTTIGKIARQAVDDGRTVLIACADTFRAAAIEQLGVWADRSDVPIIANERGSDPAAVAFDAVARAADEGIDLTLIDTAGRLHTARGLMDELDKIARVVARDSAAPVRTLLVMDAVTGQNGILQARRFHELLGVDGIALTKLDGTAKGGVAVAIARELSIPIVLIGVGEGAHDLKPFDAEDFVGALLTTA
jgi:fused signal recognition particle receptor